MKYVTDKYKGQKYGDLTVFNKANDQNPDPEKRTGCSFDDFIVLKKMYKTPEYSFESNKHNKTLLPQIQGANKSANSIRLYPGAFSETLVQMMKERKISNKKLEDSSLVGEKTI